MSVLEHDVPTPQPNHHKPHSDGYNVSSNVRSFCVSPPTGRIVHVANFHYLLIVDSPYKGVQQSNCHSCIQAVIHTIPNNLSFPQESVYGRKSRLASHKDGPPPPCGSRTLSQTFEVPDELWARTLYGRGCRAVDGSHQLPPDSKVNLNIDKHVSPQRPNTSNSCSVLCTQRHLEQSHMSNTTISKQSFQACLRKRSKTSNNHRKDPKKSQRCSKGAAPLCLPVYSPESKNSNFWHHGNPQRNTRPSSSVNVGNPEMQRGCRLFPKKSHAHKPNTQQLEQRRFPTSPFCNVFNNANFGFPSLPVDKSNPQQQLTAPKSTLLEVFHCSFNRKSTFRIQSTLYHQGKALLFHALVHGHQICCLNQQILSHLGQQCQINIFWVANCCSFLPSIRNPQYQKSSQKQSATQHRSIMVFLKRSSQINTLQRSVEHQCSAKKAPK